MHIQFVMFHAFGDVAEAIFESSYAKDRHERKISKSLDGGLDLTPDVISMSMHSINQTYPEAEIILLTDNPSNQIKMPSNARVERTPVDISKLNLTRVRQYREAVDRSSDDGFMVFVDTDMLFFRRFDEIMKDDFDVALTIRKKRRIPINAGFYVANMRSKERVLEFFDSYIEAYEALDSIHYAWGGIQTSLARMVGAPALNIDRPRFAEWGNIVIKYLPAKVYNFTPDGRMLRWRLFPPRSKVLHFRGDRKRAMGAYYRIYVQPEFWRAIRAR